MTIRIYIPAHYDRMDMVKALTNSGYHTWIEDNGLIGSEQKFFVCFECDDKEVERFDHEGNNIRKTCANCKHLDEWDPINKISPCQYCNRKILSKWESIE